MTAEEEKPENIENETKEPIPIEALKDPGPEEKLQEEFSILNDKYLRLYSDFENFKRRSQKERMDYLKSAGSDVIISLLPVLDDLERALKSMGEIQGNPAAEGVQLIFNKLSQMLQGRGLYPIQAKNQVFDTDFHEAVGQIPVGEEMPKGTVMEELEKGYLLNGKVIRHAKVLVSS